MKILRYKNLLNRDIGFSSKVIFNCFLFAILSTKKGYFIVTL